MYIALGTGEEALQCIVGPYDELVATGLVIIDASALPLVWLSSMPLLVTVCSSVELNRVDPPA
jgi:hypothetical protein